MNWIPRWLRPRTPEPEVMTQLPHHEPVTTAEPGPSRDTDVPDEKPATTASGREFQRFTKTMRRLKEGT